ncbi:MAG: DUF4411 family protein [Bacteroidetes bacterium]|nr:MAG: DUF4411 family protein [Bacteroidota bacterium]
MKSENNIYFIDSSALITVNRYYPSKVFPDLWKYIEELLKRKRMLSHEMVFDEIVPTSGPKDEIGKLIAKHKSSFCPITNKQGQLALKILSNFPRLIDPRAKKDEADPWIIALVIEKMEEVSLFGKDSDFVVVSAESEKSDTKIPAVCKYFKVRHMNLFQFFEDNGWEFTTSKKT